MPRLRRKKPTSLIEREDDGFRVYLLAEDRSAIASLMADMRDVLVSGGQSASLRRLHPPAYHLAADEEAEEEYQRLMHAELVASQIGALDTVASVLADGFERLLTAEETHQLMVSTNYLRLVLGTMLDVGEDDDDDAVPSNEAAAMQLQLYRMLTWIVAAAVDALGGE